MTLPVIRPGAIADAVFAFIHSFDEVVITSLLVDYPDAPLKSGILRNVMDPTIAAPPAKKAQLEMLRRWQGETALDWNPSQRGATRLELLIHPLLVLVPLTNCGCPMR